MLEEENLKESQVDDQIEMNEKECLEEYGIDKKNYCELLKVLKNRPSDQSVFYYLHCVHAINVLVVVMTALAQKCLK